MTPCTNNDRLKFRVWDNDVKEYIEDGALLDGRTGFISGNGNYTIEQCTGLRDVTGKLIYEGDIIKYNFPGTLPEIVAWNPKSCRFISHLARDTCMVFATNLGRDGDLPNFAVRVIGNIHEEKSK